MGEHQYLALRQRLKEKISKKMHRESGFPFSITGEKSTKLPLHRNNYGSLFGPSQTVYSTRLIQECKILSLNDSTDKGSKSDKSQVTTLNRMAKIQRLKETRDYSFLLSDNQELMPTPPTKISPSASLVNDGGPQEKKSDTLHSHTDSKRASVRKSKVASLALRKQETKPNRTRPEPEGLPIETNVANVKNKAAASDQNKLNLKIRFKLHGASSKPHLNKSIEKQNSSKKRPFRHISGSEYDHYEGEKARNIIRRMFNTKRFAGRDDSDIYMEASFQDIVKEEKRSERLARKEDQKQLRLMKEEEQRQRMAKRPKQH